MAEELDILNEGVLSLDRKLDSVIEFLNNSEPKNNKTNRNSVDFLINEQIEKDKKEKSIFNNYDRKKKIYQAIPISLDTITPQGRKDLTKLFKNLMPAPSILEKIQEKEKSKINWPELIKNIALVGGIAAAIAALATFLKEDMLKELKAFTKAGQETYKAFKDFLNKPAAAGAAAKAAQAGKPAAAVTEATNAAKVLTEAEKDAERIAKIANSLKTARPGITGIESFLKNYDELAKASNEFISKFEKIGPLAVKDMYLRNLFEVSKPESAANKQIMLLIKNTHLTPDEAKAYFDLIKNRYIESITTAAKYGFGPDSDVFRKLIKDPKLSAAELEQLQKTITSSYGSMVEAGLDKNAPLVKALSEGKLSQQQIELISKSINEFNSNILNNSLQAQQKIIIGMVEKGALPSEELLKTLQTGDDLLIRLATQRYISLINAGIDPQSPLFLKLLGDVKLGDAETARIQEKLKTLNYNILSKNVDELNSVISKYYKGTEFGKILDEVVRLKELGLTPEEIKAIKPQIKEVYIATRTSFLNEVVAALKESPKVLGEAVKDIVKNDILTPEQYQKLTAPIKSFYQKYLSGILGSDEALKAIEETAETAAKEVPKNPGFIDDLKTILRPLTETAVGRMVGRGFIGLGIGLAGVENYDWYQKEVERITKEKAENPDLDMKKELSISMVTAVTTFLTQAIGFMTFGLGSIVATFLNSESFRKSIETIFNSFEGDKNDIIDRRLATIPISLAGAFADVFVKGGGAIVTAIGDFINWSIKKITGDDDSFRSQWYEEFRKDFIERIKKFSIADWIIKLIGLDKSEKSPDTNKPIKSASNNTQDQTEGAGTNSTVQADFVYRPGMKPVPFSPQDTIIGVKELKTLVEPMERSFEYYDKALKSFNKTTEESNKKLIYEMREDRRNLVAIADSIKKLSETLQQNNNLSVVNNSRNNTNITLSPTTSKAYRDSRFYS